MRLRALITALSFAALVGCPTTEKSDDDDDGGGEVEGDEAGECGDGADNDANGMFDCDDPGCAGSPDCDDGGDEPDDNEAPTAPTVTLAPAAPTTVDDLNCTRIADASDPNGDPLTYAVRFLVDGVTVQESASETLSHERFDKGQAIQCSMAASDGWLTGDAGVSDEVVVINTAPVVSDVGIDPALATADDPLLCSYDFDDADLDSDQSTLVWTVNGVDVGTDMRLVSGYVVDDEVTCTVTGDDGEEVGNTASAAIVVANALPTIDTVTLSPADADIRDTLTCTPGATVDADGETAFDYIYAWEVDGAAIAATTSELDAESFSVGSVVRCSVTPNDGTDDGDAVWSDALTILSGPDLQLSDTTWDHGTVESGCVDEAEITLTNNGSDTLHVSAVTASGDAGFTTDFLAALSIAPSGSETLTLVFSPESEASYSGTLSVTTNDPDGDQTIAVTGAGEWASFSESTTGNPSVEVDLIFALDRSASMHDEITNLETVLPDMTAAMESYAIDYQLAITVEDTGCINGSDLWVDDTYSSSDADTAISTMINLGGAYGSNTEAAFTLLDAALSETGSGGCNEGLVRSGAQLALIGMSDEPEQSTGVWSDHVTSLQGYKSDPNDVVIHAIGGDYPSGCGSSAHYSGMYEATVATGGTFISICTTDLSADLVDLAYDMVPEDAKLYPLSDVPYDETLITVYVDGVDAAGDWSYDATDNAVQFDANFPTSSSTVLFEYEGTHLSCE